MIRNWKDRVVAAASGTQTGAILAAALGEKIPAPFFTGRATITSDGYVMADFTDRNGEPHSGAFVGSVTDLISNSRRLADHVKLSAGERVEFFAAVRKWVATDYSSDRLIGDLK